MQCNTLYTYAVGLLWSQECSLHPCSIKKGPVSSFHALGRESSKCENWKSLKVAEEVWYPLHAILIFFVCPDQYGDHFLYYERWKPAFILSWSPFSLLYEHYIYFLQTVFLSSS